MAKYSKRRRSRRGSKRKRRGGNLSHMIEKAANGVKAGVNNAANAGQQVVAGAGQGAHDVVAQGAAGAHNLVESVSGKTKETADAARAAAVEAERKASTGVSNLTSKFAPSYSGGRRGGSGRCCFPAKFCGSRKRKGNKRRSIRTGRCCLPVKSKKCGAKKKNGRKTKKNKRKRKSGMFNMFGGG